MKKWIKKIFYKAPMICIASFLISLERRLRQFKGQLALRQIKTIGKDCLIQGQVTIYYPECITLGSYVRIGYGTFLYGIGGIKIGDNTQISRNVVIYSGNHDITGSTVPYDDNYIKKEVCIGRSVWIGMNVCITPGVTIGDGAIIGMGTVVSKDVPEGAIVVGAEQRIVKYRDMKEFRQKEKEKKLYGAYF